MVYRQASSPKLKYTPQGIVASAWKSLQSRTVSTEGVYLSVGSEFAQCSHRRTVAMSDHLFQQLVCRQQR